MNGINKCLVIKKGGEVRWGPCRLFMLLNVQPCCNHTYFTAPSVQQDPLLF